MPTYIPVHFERLSGPFDTVPSDPRILWVRPHRSGSGYLVCIDASVFEAPPDWNFLVFTTASGHMLQLSE
jgi:hypothetical protein